MPVLASFGPGSNVPWAEKWDGITRTIERSFTVTLDPSALNSTPSTIRAAAEAAGLPVPWVTTYDGLTCKTCEPTRASDAVVVYRATYDNKPPTVEQNQQVSDPADPTNWDPKVRVLVNQIELPLSEDVNGKAITNAAGVQLLDRLLVPDVELSFEVTVNVVTIPSWWLGLRRTYSDHAQTITVVPARYALPSITFSALTGTLRYVPLSLEEAEWNSITYVKLAFRLDLCRPRKFRGLVYGGTVDSTPVAYNSWLHDAAYLNAGFTALHFETVEGTLTSQLKKIILKNGDEPREEMLLQANGSFDEDQQEPDDAIYMIPDAYTAADYSVLPAVS